jgi:hypothetical protein
MNIFRSSEDLRACEYAREARRSPVTQAQACASLSAQPLPLTLTKSHALHRPRRFSKPGTTSRARPPVTRSDGTIRFWDRLLVSRDLDAWRARICAMVRRNLTRAEWRHYVGEDSYRETCPNTFKR